VIRTKIAYVQFPIVPKELAGKMLCKDCREVLPVGVPFCENPERMKESGAIVTKPSCVYCALAGKSGGSNEDGKQAQA